MAAVRFPSPYLRIVGVQWAEPESEPETEPVSEPMSEPGSEPASEVSEPPAHPQGWSIHVLASGSGLGSPFSRTYTVVGDGVAGEQTVTTTIEDPPGFFRSEWVDLASGLADELGELFGTNVAGTSTGTSNANWIVRYWADFADFTPGIQDSTGLGGATAGRFSNFANVDIVLGIGGVSMSNSVPLPL